MIRLASACCSGWRLTLFAVLCGLGGVMVAETIRGTTSMAADDQAKHLRHVVLFKFKDTSSKSDVQGVVDAFRQLPSQIPEIDDFEFGTDNSPEGKAEGFTHCFLVTFRSEKNRDAYLPHAAHQKFVQVLLPHLDKVQVIDYWAGK